MAETRDVYQLEVKLPSQNGQSVTQVIQLATSYQNMSDKSLIFSTRFEFPNTGEANKLYIDVGSNKIYIWVDNHYIVCGSDYNEIDLIDCGGADKMAILKTQLY
jgi:hypothetical protein